MQFAIGVIDLECSFVKHSHGPLGIRPFKIYRSVYILLLVYHSPTTGIGCVEWGVLQEYLL
jgi:hypothetical protein